MKDKTSDLIGPLREAGAMPHLLGAYAVLARQAADQIERDARLIDDLHQILNENEVPLGDGLGLFTLRGRLQAYLNRLAAQETPTP